MLIDYSLAKDSLQIELKENEEPGDFQREFERVISRMKKCIDLRLNIHGEPDTEIEQMMLDIENAKSTGNMYLRETLLDKVLQQLLQESEPEFELTEEQQNNLDEEQKEQHRIHFEKELLKDNKQRMLLASEIACLAFDANLIDLAFKAGKYCIQKEWDPQKNAELVISQ